MKIARAGTARRRKRIKPSLRLRPDTHCFRRIGVNPATAALDGSRAAYHQPLGADFDTATAVAELRVSLADAVERDQPAVAPTFGAELARNPGAAAAGVNDPAGALLAAVVKAQPPAVAIADDVAHQRYSSRRARHTAAARNSASKR